MNTVDTYTGDGATTDFDLTFSYTELSDIKVTVDGVEQPFSFVNPSRIQFDTAPANGTHIRIARVTDVSSPAVDFQDGAIIRADDLDLGFRQIRHRAEELNSVTAEQASVAVRVPDGEPAITLPDPEDRANTLFGFDASGNALFTLLSSIIEQAKDAARTLVSSMALTVTGATGQTVTTIGLLAGIASPTNGQVAHVADTRRGGTFKFYTDAAYLSETGVDLTDHNAADPGEGVFVRADGGGGSWVRQTNHLSFRMFGADPDGNIDATTPMRQALYLATKLKLPIRDHGTFFIDDAVIYAGTLTDSMPSTPDLATGLSIIGDPYMTITSPPFTGGAAHFKFNKSDHITFKNVFWDMTGIDPATGTSGGQVSFRDCDYVHVENVHKFKNDAGVPSTGGSLIDFESTIGGTGCRYATILNVSNTAGSQNDAATVVNTQGLVSSLLMKVYAENCGEAVDFTGGDDNVLIDIEGLNLLNEAVDMGSSSRNHIRKVKCTNCAGLVTIKTEQPNASEPSWLPGQTGSNDNIIEDYEAIGNTGPAIKFGAGGTDSQSLTGNKFYRGKIRSSVVADPLTSLIFIANGDGASVNRGTVIDDLEIDVNQGVAIDFEPLYDFQFKNITSNATTLFRSRVSNLRDDVNGLVENVTSTGGGFNLVGLYGLKFRNLRLDGARALFQDAAGLRFLDSEIFNAPSDALVIAVTNGADVPDYLDIVVSDFKQVNNSLTSAGVAVRLDALSTSNVVNGVHLRDITLIDDQDVPTSNGLSFDNISANWQSNSLTGLKLNGVPSVYMNMPGDDGYTDNPQNTAIPRIVTHNTNGNAAFNVNEMPRDLLVWDVPQTNPLTLGLENTFSPNIGHRVRVFFKDTGSSGVNVKTNGTNGTVIATFSTGERAEFVFDGTDWVQG